MNLKNYIGENVKLVSKSGHIYTGHVWDYVYPDDNEPEIEAIIMDYPVREDGYKSEYPMQFNAPDIKSIEII